MPELARLAAQIEIAAGHITPYWPLRSFIAANPLQGMEDQPFEHAARAAAALFGGRPYPTPALLTAALEEGRIDARLLAETALRHGRPEAASAAALAQEAAAPRPAAPSAVNRAMIRWLAAFLDEGQAAWPMPGRERGLWPAIRALARHDAAIPRGAEAEVLPADPLQAIAALVAEVPEAERVPLFTHHLAALSGWAGYVKWRAQAPAHPWAAAAPATLADLLALRLFLVRQFAAAPQEPRADIPAGSRQSRLRPRMRPAACAAKPSRGAALAPEGRNAMAFRHAAMAPAAPATPEAAAIWLEAWEETWRRELTGRLVSAAAVAPGPRGRVQAQLVFCIDVRSEVLRRHLEAAGPWETLGFAGFFGAAVAVRPFGAGAAHASCPVLLQPRHLVPDIAAPGAEAAGAAHLAGLSRLGRARQGLRALKESLAGAFGFVEASGAAFGAAMVARTVAPRGMARLAGRLAAGIAPPAPTVPRIALACDEGSGAPTGLSPAEQAAAAEGALRIMGLTSGFAPLVVLCGHGGQATNNPFAAGLDCGACGGNRGGPNARIMAAILNRPDVRAALAGRGIAIPAETVFLGAEHDTTTDAVTFWGTEAAAAHGAILARLRADLATARRAAAAERLARLPGAARGDAVAAAETRAADWAETRPEWALARNAAFIVADRAFTRGLDLEGRCFLHSYDWQADAEGTALEVILTAPMVVAEWINTQYYFSTVDNAAFGAGSKVVHNVVGGFGVMQGNASDLMTGLPAQSVFAAEGLPYHEPLRLLAVVRAPLARVEALVAKHRILQTLFGNGWVALLVADPATGRFLRRERDGSWRDAAPAATPAPALVAA